MLRLDHVMYVARDLEGAARRIRFESGFHSYPGGEHTGIGTHNRVIPVGGDQYVELMAVADETVAAANPVGAQVLQWARERDGLRVWCLAIDDIDVVAKRLELVASPWTRIRPDGTELRWRLAGVERAMADPSLPFFIQWDIAPADHPSRGAVEHTVQPDGIAWLEVGGDAAKLARWTDGADLPVRVIDADEGPRALGVTTRDGEVVLR
jgi:hypothetical protein